MNLKLDFDEKIKEIVKEELAKNGYVNVKNLTVEGKIDVSFMLAPKPKPIEITVEVE